MYKEGTVQVIIGVLGREVEKEIRTVLGVRKRPSTFDECLFLLRNTSFGSEEEEERLNEALQLASITEECLSLLECSSGSTRSQVFERALETAKTPDDYFLINEKVPSYMEDNERFSEKVVELIAEFESVKECLDFYDKISGDQHKEKAINAAFELADNVEEYLEIYQHPTVSKGDKRKALEEAVELIFRKANEELDRKAGKLAEAIDDCLDLYDEVDDQDDKVWVQGEILRRDIAVQGYLKIYRHPTVGGEDKNRVFNLALGVACNLEEGKEIFSETESDSPEAAACIRRMAEIIEAQPAETIS